MSEPVCAGLDVSDVPLYAGPLLGPSTWALYLGPLPGPSTWAIYLGHLPGRCTRALYAALYAAPVPGPYKRPRTRLHALRCTQRCT